MTTKASLCKGCGESFRKGKRRVIVNFDGTLTPSLVCPRCVVRSVSFVTPLSRATMTMNGRESLEAIGAKLRAYLTAAKMVAPAAGEFTDGRVEGLECALSLIHSALAGVAA
jgi:hypothetical protein